MNIVHFTLYNKATIQFLVIINFIVFFIGLFGFLFRSNHYIYLIICNEIMLFAIVLQFLLFGAIYDDITPQIFVLFLLLISSAEVVIVFSVIIRFYRLTSVIYIKPIYYIQ